MIAGVVFADSGNTPNYVGIRENQEIVWKTVFDNDPFEEYLEDDGYNESSIEAISDYVFDGPFDTDVEGWRIYVLKIYEEEERDYKGEDVEYVELLLNWYSTDSWNEKDWNKEEKNAPGSIGEYDKDAYFDAMYWDLGLLKFWLSKDVDWSELADEFEEDLEDNNEDGGASTETTTFFFQKQKCGISTDWEPSGCEEFESISKYTQNGILLYYEYSYDGDTIFEIELDNAYFVENWWWIALIIGLSIIGVIIVIVVVKIYKSRSVTTKVKF